MISISLYYDKKLDLKTEKRQLDQFAIKCKLSQHGLQGPGKITTYISDFHYGSILFKRNFVYKTCFKFRRPTDTTFMYCDITYD